MKRRKFSVVDIVIVLVVLITAFSALIFINVMRTDGDKIEVKVKGETFYIGDLQTENKKEVKITDSNGKTTNILVIENSTAYVKWANCKDQKCVNHYRISKVDESIVCLPNEVEIRIVKNTGAEDAAW